MSDLLLSELFRVQREYKNKLIMAKELLFSQNTDVVLIDLASFWRENKKIVECALNYVVKPYDKLFFTAATIMDIEDNEHIPFLSIGNFHIWDDPIFSYASLMTNTPNQNFNEKIKNQILATIDDNIRIIENTNNMIFVLPIRLLFDNKEESSVIASKLFLKFFEETLDNEETYFNKFKTIDNVIDGLHEDIRQYICFGVDDEILELKERFEKYIENNELPVKKTDSEVFIFRFVIIGFLMQAIDILTISRRFQMYPYVRFIVPLKYMTMLAGNLDDQPEFINIVDTMCACYVLHKSMPTENIIDDLVTYKEKLCSINFSQRFFENIRKLENKNEFSPKKIEKEIAVLIDEINI